MRKAEIKCDFHILSIISILTIAILITGVNEAYADIPNIDTFVADDPDNGDIIYSVGDTFTLTFSLPINVTAAATMSQGAIDGNFTLSGGAVFGAAYSGLWSGDRLTLTITVNTVGAPNPTIGGTTVSALGTSNLGHAGDPDTPLTLTGIPTLAGDYGVILSVVVGGGDGCSGECAPPTLGIDSTGKRLVDNGFSYNGNPVDVERYFTPYPLITTNVGIENRAVFTIYENSGPQNIKHFALAFGLAQGEIMTNSKLTIQWDKSHNGKETLTVTDPENALDNVKVTAWPGPCRSDSIFSKDCLIVTVYHTFRQPLDFNIVSTNVWDFKLNAWQNYYNDGVEVQGESLNPPAQYVGIHEGYLVTITETGKNTAIDDKGNTWTFDKTWIKDFIYKGKIDDPITSHGYDRNHVKFSTYKQGQELVASSLFEKYFRTSVYQEPAFSEILDIKFYEFPDTIDRKFDPVLQAKMHEEDIRAQKYLEELFAKIYPHLVSAEYSN